MMFLAALHVLLLENVFVVEAALLIKTCSLYMEMLLIETKLLSSLLYDLPRGNKPKNVT